MRMSMLVALAGTLAVGGCGPVMSIAHRGTAFRNLTDEDVTIQADFVIRNRGALAVTMHACDYRMTIGSSHFMKGASTQAVTVAPGERGHVSLPLVVDFREVVGSVAAARRGTMVPYKIAVAPRFRMLGFLPLADRPETECVGELPLVGKPTVRVDRVRVKRLEPREAVVEVAVLVTNPNAFPITLLSLDYHVEADRYPLRRKEWLGPQVAKAKQTIAFQSPWRIEIPSDRGGLADVLRQPQIHAVLNGKGELAVGTGTLGFTFEWTGRVPVIRGDLHSDHSIPDNVSLAHFQEFIRYGLELGTYG